MSRVRLTFLYPLFYRPCGLLEFSVATGARILEFRAPSSRSSRSRRTYATSLGGAAGLGRRHGKAVEPLISAGKNRAETSGGGGDDTKHPRKGKKFKKTSPVSEADKEAPGPKGGAGRSAQPLAPLATMLQLPTVGVDAAAAVTDDGRTGMARPLHAQTPVYVHHFDTYTLVQQVQAGGFTGAQSITAMKAVRGLLAANLAVARAGLVSKSDVENESYLFRAACSELKTKIQNARRKSEETMRRDRTSLQHEVEILKQKLTQELLTLKDDLKGMFDDRKMSVRMEQRTMESKIQELNYKITVMLNSDSKFEVEGLRWLLTRRSVMGIIFMAFMVLTSLRYASYKSHEDMLRKEKEAALKPEEFVDSAPASAAGKILGAS